MIKYIVSFSAFLVYIIIEEIIAHSKKNIFIFNVLFLIVGIAGLIITNVTKFDMLEYFFILVTLYSIINLVKCKKKQ